MLSSLFYAFVNGCSSPPPPPTPIPTELMTLFFFFFACLLVSMFRRKTRTFLGEDFFFFFFFFFGGGDLSAQNVSAPLQKPKPPPPPSAPYWKNPSYATGLASWINILLFCTIYLEEREKSSIEVNFDHFTIIDIFTSSSRKKSCDLLWRWACT